MKNDVSKIEYPFYSTNEKKLQTESPINPYAEFIEFSIREYYPKLNYSDLTMQQFFASSQKEEILRNIMGKNANDYYTKIVAKNNEFIKNSRDVISIEYYKDEEKVCEVNLYTTIDYSPNVSFLTAPTKMIRIIFSENESLKYLIPDVKLNILVLHELLNEKFSHNQINILSAVICGILNINEYVKVHKLHLIKINSIKSYLRAYPELDGEILEVYNYDCAYLTYKGKNGIKLYNIDYNNYVNCIDKMIEEYAD